MKARKWLGAVSVAAFVLSVSTVFAGEEKKWEKHFEAMDTNHDGQVSEQEFLAYKEAHHHHHHHHKTTTTTPSTTTPTNTSTLTK